MLLIPLILLVHLILLASTKFTLWPEMVVYPYLLNNGFLLYKDIINPYPPFLTFALSFFSKVFGYQPLPYQLLTWSLVLIIDLSIFLIAEKIFKNNLAALLSLAFFVALSVPFAINGLWFDLVQTPLFIFALYFFYVYLKKDSRDRNLIWSSLFLGLAFLIKQHTFWLHLWLLVILLISNRFKNFQKISKEVFFILGPVLLISFIEILVFAKTGLLKDFLFWTIYLPLVKASALPGYLLLPTARQLVVIISMILFFTPLLLNRKTNLTLFPYSAFALFILAYPRFDYFHLIPSLAVLAIVFSENLKSLAKTVLPAKLAFFVSLIFLTSFTLRYSLNNWTNQIRFFEEDIIGSAGVVQSLTTPNEPIFIQNGPDQILVLAERLPTKPWATQFPWYLESGNLQDRIVYSLTDQAPRLIVSKPYESKSTYELGSYRPAKIANFVENHYQNLVPISGNLWLKIRK